MKSIHLLAVLTVSTASTFGQEMSELTYPIVDTNQGFSYNNSELLMDAPAEGEAFYGQDAQYTGTVPSYTDNGDGTITDNVTGLTWTQEISSYAMPWSDASSYCESLVAGGYDDWRLPTVKELWSIRDFSQGWPWVDTDYFYLVGDGSDLGQHHSWTSNAYLVESEYQNEQVQGDPAFIVNDWTGHIKAMSGSRFVRAVRGNTSYGLNDFVDNGDGTVSDNATGLMWSQDDNGEALNWEGALAYAEGATTAGYDDWRLPNAKELQSIADYSGTFPAMDTSVFNLTELTNVLGQTDYPFYWSSTSNPYIEAYHAESEDSDLESEYVPGYTYAWLLAAGYCPDIDGYDLHGSGAVVFDTKAEEVSDGSGIEVFYHYVRLVRGGNVTETPDGDPSTVDEDRVVSFPDGDTGNGGGGPTDSPDFATAAAILGVTEAELIAAMGEPGEGEPDFAAIAAQLGVTEQELLDALAGSTDAVDDETIGRLINISTRAYVSQGEKVTIAGFVIEGTIPVTLLIQAVGSELSEEPYSVQAPLLDTVLQVYDSNVNLIFQNDDWEETDATSIADASDLVGSTMLESGSGSSAILATLNAGAYTAVLSSHNETSGIALVEVYDMTTKQDE